MKSYLLVYSIGPVQSFIAAARKTEDFWSGSYLLSFLTEETIRAALGFQANNVAMISPAVTLEQLGQRINSESVDVAAFPNRFLLSIEASSDEDVVTFAKKLEQTTVTTLRDLANNALSKVFGELVEDHYMKRLVHKQISELLELFWAFEEWTGSYNDTRFKVEKRLASVKNNRSFSLQAQDGLVCTVCGSREALNKRNFSADASNKQILEQIRHTWESRREDYQEVSKDKGARIRDNERLCAVCLTKRVARQIFKEKFEQVEQYFKPFPSVAELTVEKNPYYAIIMMDGDDMGKWISGEDNRLLSEYDLDNKEINEIITEEYHRDISRRLTIFSEESVPKIIKQANARLVYAGGDDVLAFVPLMGLLPLIHSLREAFGSVKGLDKKATASMGVVIAHKKEPLQRVISTVREIEGKAKGYVHGNQKKDAVAFGLLAKSGQIREAVVPWYTGDSQQSSTMDILIRLRDALGETLSSTFLFHFGEAFFPLMPQGQKADIDQNIIDLELRRLISRSSKKMKQEELNQLIDDLLRMYTLSHTFLKYVHLLEIVRFMAGKYKKEEE